MAMNNDKQTYIAPVPKHNQCHFDNDVTFLYGYDKNGNVFLFFVGKHTWLPFYIERGDNKMSNTFHAFSLWLRKKIALWQAIELPTNTTFRCNVGGNTEKFVFGCQGDRLIEVTFSYRCYPSLCMSSNLFHLNFVNTGNVKKFIRIVEKVADAFAFLATFIMQPRT